MAETIQSGRVGITRASPNAPGVWARYVNIALGAWLFISGFVFEQPHNARVDAWVVGIAVAAIAAWAIFAEGARWLNTALAVWLFFTSFGLFHLTRGPLWNDILVALAVFVVSLVPNVPAGGRTVGRATS